MCLLNIKKDQECIIDAINLDSSFKCRLASMGLCAKDKICVKQFGWFKSTLQVEVNSTLIALRKDEAKCIEVHVA
jgi:ferrous iron transport protein A